ncbi:MAG: elongation factor G [Bdellovibrionales bacterium]|jgi:elongation factor G|nr:elongation factor G [Bdellovibrionales bacterium]MBT3526644.1 elongation factor G [Bdellovibrionales bacterium]MBT7669842.1 elongation factor G [Bdellovibrionales bacterium]
MSNSSTKVVAICGPYQSGKTSLMESMLKIAGTIKEKGRVEDGNAVGSGSQEAIGRQMSIEAIPANCVYQDSKFTFLDCPGSVEFMQDSLNAMQVADAVVVVCEPNEDSMMALTPTLKFLSGKCIPHYIFINKLDTLSGDVNQMLAALKDRIDTPLVTRTFPIMEGEAMVGLVDLVHQQAYKFHHGKRSEKIEIPSDLVDEVTLARQEMLDGLADFNDELMEKILEEVPLTTEEITTTIEKGTSDGLITPLFLGQSVADSGIKKLLDCLEVEVPSCEVAAKRLEIDLTKSSQLCQIFKTYNLMHKGKLSMSRVWRGEVKEGQAIGAQPLGGIMTMHGLEVSKSKNISVGDIISFSRVEQLVTGDTLSGEKGEEEKVVFDPPIKPLFSQAVEVVKKQDEMKLMTALQKLTEEDLSLQFIQNDVSKELVLWGQGEVQLLVALEKLANRNGIEVKMNKPQVDYKETIRGKATIQGKHKKQTGGHGQFGNVYFDINPKERDSGFEFIENITGGVIPKNYFGAIENGVREYLSIGPLGFNVVDVEVRLFDGSYHKVDSSDLAFKLAAMAAMKDAMPKCQPILLEPIAKVEISVPNEHLSKAQKLVSGLRGQLLGFDSKKGWGGWDQVSANIPEAEMHNLIIELRSLTKGLGFFSYDFAHFTELGGKEADQVVTTRRVWLDEHRMQTPG